MNAVLSENKKWELIDSGFCTGSYNMALDLKLVDRCSSEDTAFLRFYGWKPYAISLGYNQNRLPGDIKIDHSKCSSDGIDVVTRPTGGRAVFHSEELTYSVVFRSSGLIRDLYRDISCAILNGLKLLGPELDGLSFTKDTPDLLKLMKTGMYNLCFNSAVKYEINYRGKKLVGSAQRKFGDIVLQHGSILLGNHHRNIVEYLCITDGEKVKMKREIEEKTICINDLTAETIMYNEAKDAVFRGFVNTFEMDFTGSETMGASEHELKAELTTN